MNHPLPDAVRLAFRLSPSLLARLRVAAQTEGVKTSEIVRRALAAYFGDDNLGHVNPVGRPAAPPPDTV